MTLHRMFAPAAALPAAAADHRLLSWACGAIVAAALLVGGANWGLGQLLVQLASLPLFYVLLVPPVDAHAGAPGWPLGGRIAAVVVCAALLQLVPLPPMVWKQLPAGDQVAQILGSAGLTTGWGTGWRPLALDPSAAVLALAAVFAPIVLYLGVGRLPLDQVRRLLGAIALFALFSAVIGDIQRIAGLGNIYGSEHFGTSTGLMINRNHHADLLIAGILLLPLAVRPDVRRRAAPLISAGIVFLAFSVTATISRMGLLLVGPALVVSLALLWNLSRWRIAALLAVAVAAAAVLPQLPVYARLVARFSGATQEERVAIAEGTMVALRHFWPLGSGYGSFVPVYFSFEDLDTLGSAYVVAAHNDYLQLVLEGGLPALLTIAALMVFLGVQIWRIRPLRIAASEKWAPLCVIAALLVHSAADYPLRMAAIAAVFAACLGATDAVQQKIASGDRNALDPGLTKPAMSDQ